MRKTILSLTIMTIMAAAISTSYGQESIDKSLKPMEKVQGTQLEVNANQDPAETRMDTISEYQKFKSQSEMKIKNNEKSIADLKLNTSNVVESNRIAYQEKVTDFEQKNYKLTKELAEYKYEESGKWATFKLEFNRDMDELGKALKDFNVDGKI